MSRQLTGWAPRVFLGLVLVTGSMTIPGTANAQSPTPNYKMEDAWNSGWPTGANAIVVEGLGSLGCAYGETEIKQKTVYWINDTHRVATEISPQLGCGSRPGYEELVRRIKRYVEANAANPGKYWAGIMLDEEPDFGFGVNALETLNHFTEGIMESTPGLSWYFTEDFPNGSAGDWTLAQYNGIMKSSWMAPQVYNSYMPGFVNNECTYHGRCTNNVTVDSQGPSPWNSPSWVTSQINGSPWSDNGYWCSCNWYNLWQPQ